MIAHNRTDKNGVKTSPPCSFDHFQSLSQADDIPTSWKLGLLGGEMVAKYHLELVKMHLPQHNIRVNRKVSNLAQLRRNEELLEIKQYRRKFEKQR